MPGSPRQSFSGGEAAGGSPGQEPGQDSALVSPVADVGTAEAGGSSSSSNK